MSKRGPKRERAQRTTPARAHFVEVDDECADAAERDIVTYLSGTNPNDGSPR
jgi:hypothetical protein